MLLKLIGSVLLIVGGAGLGIYYGMSPALRKRELEQLKRALMLMYSETEFGRTPLAEQCRSAADICDNAVGGIFSCFALGLEDRTAEDTVQLWKNCVKTACVHTHFATEDVEKITVLGNSLGVVDINRQLSAIKNVTDYIDFKCDELEEVSKKNMRLYKNTGVLLGIFAVILLF